MNLTTQVTSKKGMRSLIGLKPCKVNTIVLPLKYKEPMRSLIPLLLLLCVTSHAHSQTDNDTICFPVTQYKEVLKLAVKGKYCDSLLILREKQFEEASDLLGMCESVARSQEKKLKKTQRKTKILSTLCLGLGVAVLVETIILID
jgi:hypothetical protein